MQFTKDQRAAIDHEGSALLVSAAAGSGKTAVLVERAARLLTREKDPVPADRLLIVTFTRAAAASLRAKLAARLAEEQLKHPGSAWLRRQRMLLQRASIGTIDSFCLQLVQTHFGKLDIPPDFSTADGPQLARLRAEALAAALENAYADPDFCAFADLYGKGRSDKQAARVLEQLYDFLSSMPFPDASLDKMAADWAADRPLDATEWGKALRAEGARGAKCALSLAQENLAEAEGDGELGNYLPALQSDVAAARAVEDQLRRLGIPGHVVCRRLRTEISYDLRPGETVSLIARCGEKGTGRWLRALSRRTPEGVAEVLLAGGREGCSFGGKPCRSLPREGAWARDLNAAARAATGDYLLFLVQGVMPLERGWLTQLRMYAQRPDVACVGSLLMTPEKIYLHGGYAVDVPGGALSHQGGVSFFNRPYMLTDRQVRNVTAVSASMLMIRRETFLALGGFGDYASDLAAASLGLRAQGAGLWNVFVPEAAAVWHGKEPPCLTGPAPAEDLARFREEFGEHPPEKNYSPLLEKQRGWMILDTARPAGES